MGSLPFDAICQELSTDNLAKFNFSGRQTHREVESLRWIRTNKNKLPRLFPRIKWILREGAITLGHALIRGLTFKEPHEVRELCVVALCLLLHFM